MKQTPNIRITEVGPRDGLQNEPTFVATPIKIDLINQLSQSGLQYIEATSFASAKSIPQLVDNAEVFQAINKPNHVHFSALIPNTNGMQQAIAAGVKNIAVFTAASDTFNQHNIHCSTKESLVRAKEVIALAREQNMSVRAYISCTLGCPYEGSIAPQQVITVIEALLALGVDEISLGDTIGVGTPKQTKALLNVALPALGEIPLAMHFHDTYGQAIANIYTSLECGVTHFDSSVAGLGGCPYAQGASGNVATEDVLYLLHGLGLETGVDIYKIVMAGEMICKAMGRRNQSKVANALLAKGC